MEFADRELLKDLISERCNKYTDHLVTGEDKQVRDFWFIRSFFFIKGGNDFVWECLRQSKDTILVLESFAGRFEQGDMKIWPELGAEKIYKILDAFVDVWPKVELPNQWGTGSPKEEQAYRFLRDIVVRIEDDNFDCSISVLDRLLGDQRFAEFHDSCLHMKAHSERTRALRDFEAPSPREIAKLLDENRIASVEDLRALVLEELERMQVWLKGAETDPLDAFYDGGRHVDENTARNRIVDHLQPRLNPLNVSIPIERHMAKSKRCDFAAEISIAGKQKLLVVEVKGQWHPELYEAAYKQLYDRYSHHPNAAQQGIYLVLWFGIDEKVADRKNHGIKTPMELQKKIEEAMPAELVGRIDIVVLNLLRGLN